MEVAAGGVHSTHDDAQDAALVTVAKLVVVTVLVLPPTVSVEMRVEVRVCVSVPPETVMVFVMTVVA